MTDEDYMRQTIELAKESRAKYKHAIGALLVKDGKVVATALSHSHNFHAELNCIHTAFKTLNTEELSGCTLYTTQESCPILFVAGDKDSTVKNSATRKLYDKANEPKEWHLIKGMEHRYQHQPEMLTQVNKIIVNFVGQ